MQKDRPVVLSIAGFDPCAGAGVLADIKTFEQLKVMGMSVITANTVQTEDFVLSVDWLSVETVVQSIKTLMTRYQFSAVKIGLVRDFNYLKAILDCINKQKNDTFIVWDPVMKSTSGVAFFDTNDINKLSSILGPVSLITPNHDEFSLLKPHLGSLHSTSLLIKGGHRQDEVGLDLLHQGGVEIPFRPSINQAYSKHGSGCVLSSAISAYLALGKTLEEACRMAKLYIEHFLNSNPALLGYHNNG